MSEAISKIYTKSERTEIERSNGHAVHKHTAPAEEIDPHPAAMIFPLMGGTAYRLLVADVKENGLHTPCVRYRDEGKTWILDGRNRLRACAEAGIPVRWRDFGSEPSDGNDPQAWVISENVHRRHLNETQRAVIASKLATQEPGGDRSSEHSANLRNAMTQTEAAAALDVSERSIQHARVALEHGLPDLVAAMEAGLLPVSVASKVAKREDQAEILRRANLSSAENASKAIADAMTALVHGDESTDEPRQTGGRGKPEWLMRALVRHYSRIDALVCDPFAGYGSTLRSARLENRRAVGSEMDRDIAEQADDRDLREGTWQEALADVDMVDAIICDPPYSARTHAATTTRADGSSAVGLTPTYEGWTPDNIHEFVSAWSPRCRGWMVALTDSELIQDWQDAYRKAGRYAFAPVPVVIKGMSVRISGDGPSSWCVYAMVARPSTREFAEWGTLPGAYVGTKSRELWDSSEETTNGE